MIWQVSYHDILEDPNWPDLLRDYGAECSIPELGTPNPQAELYEALEKSGQFRAFAGYDDGRLVGFAAMLVYTLPHYGTKIAATESIFLARDYRSTFSAWDLMDVMERHARADGCVAFMYSAPVGSRFDRMLSASKRPRHTNNTYLVTL